MSPVSGGKQTEPGFPRGFCLCLALFCIAVLEESLQTRVQSWAVSQPAATGRPMRRRTIGPASSELGEGLAGWAVLVPSSDSLCRAGRINANFGRQLYGVSSNTLLRLASGLSEQCRLAGPCFGKCMALDLHLSRVRTGVAVMEQDCNYQLGITKYTVPVWTHLLIQGTFFICTIFYIVEQ